MTAAPTSPRVGRDRAPIRHAEIERLSQLAEARSGIAARRADGAFFTDADVARHLARRAIVPLLLEAAGLTRDEIDAALAEALDLHAALGRACRRPAARAAAIDRLSRLRVLDPTCGAGSFLLAAWDELRAVERMLGAAVVSPSQLHGVDLDETAVAACRAALRIATGDPRAGSSVRLADAQLPGVLPRADVVIGNPPFVRAGGGEAPEGLRTACVPNRSAWIVERALACAEPAARVSFVLPISTACTDAFAPARASWELACDRVHTSHFDTIPCSLFRGVVQRLSIFEGRIRDGSSTRPARWWTSTYHRWLSEERDALLERIRHVRLPPHSVGGSIAKVGTAVEARLLERLFRHEPAGRYFAESGEPRGGNRILYKRRWSYFLLFTDFTPPMWDAHGIEREPTEFKAIDVVDTLDARVLLAAFSSSLFWWYFSVFTDNRNVNRRDLAAFPIAELDPAAAARLAALGSELMDALRACAEVRTCTYRSIGTIRNTYFRQASTRPVLDRIDAELAGAYGMRDDELAFLLGYERRFRGGVG